MREVAGDVAIAGTRHAEVDLVEQEQIGVSELGMLEQGRARRCSYQLPCSMFQCTARTCIGFGDGGGGVAVSRGVRGQNRAEARLERRPFRAAPQLVERSIALDGLLQSATLGEESGSRVMASEENRRTGAARDQARVKNEVELTGRASRGTRRSSRSAPDPRRG